MKGNIIYKKTIPARSPEYAEFPKSLHPDIQDFLSGQNIKSLYTHQAEAFSHAMAGENIVITTPTASGKSLCFYLPVVQEILKTDTKFKSADEALASLKESVKKNPLLVLSAINALNNWDYNSFEKEWIQMMKTVNSLKKDDAKVIVTTIYNPAGNMKLPSTLNKIVEDIIENMNAIIEKRAGKYDYEVADVYQSSVTSHLQKDGVHPDFQGQQIIADLVCKEYEK